MLPKTKATVTDMVTTRKKSWPRREHIRENGGGTYGIE